MKPTVASWSSPARLGSRRPPRGSTAALALCLIAGDSIPLALAQAAALAPQREIGSLSERSPVLHAHHQIGSVARGFGAENIARIDGTARDLSPDDSRSKRVEAAEIYLKHIYTIFLGLRACSELRTEQADASFLSSVSLAEAGKALRAIDTAASKVGIDVAAKWAEAAPRAVVTSEALKREPRKNVAVCQKMGGLFRADEANLQNLFEALGSKQVLIPKEF